MSSLPALLMLLTSPRQPPFMAIGEHSIHGHFTMKKSCKVLSLTHDDGHEKGPKISVHPFPLDIFFCYLNLHVPAASGMVFVDIPLRISQSLLHVHRIPVRVDTSFFI